MKGLGPWSVAVDQPSALGESPFWHPHDQMLYWLDIPGRAVHRANVFMATVQTWALAQDPGCMAPATGGGLVLALRAGIYRATENPVHVHDLHATILKILGFDHEKFTYRYAGLDFRLTGVNECKVVRELLA